MDSPAVPSKRQRLSIEVQPPKSSVPVLHSSMSMVETNISWNQGRDNVTNGTCSIYSTDEWTEFLINECRISEERARQIAAQLAEQDFNNGNFESVVSEWQINAKGCKELLQEIGFKNMDIFPFITALRRHIEKEKATSEKQICNTTTVVAKRRMCNELVWAVCKGIGVVKTSDRILLTSANIYAYLEKAFRKKLIYRDLIRFLKAKNWRKFSIEIEQLEQNIEDEVVVIDQEQTENEYELLTNHMHIFLSLSGVTDLVINEESFENSHMHFFLQLIAPQLHPLVLNLTEFDDSTFSSAARFLNKMHNCINWVQLSAEHFHLKPISAAMSKCNKLAIYIWDSMMDEDQMQQFCEAFIRWINANNGGQQKICVIQYHHKTILRLLDALNKDFAGATSKQPFVIRINNFEETEALAQFTVRNARTQEQLRLRRVSKSDYVLNRQSTMEFDYYNHKQLEWEFDNLNKMDSITLKV